MIEHRIALSCSLDEAGGAGHIAPQKPFDRLDSRDER